MLEEGRLRKVRPPIPDSSIQSTPPHNFSSPQYNPHKPSPHPSPSGYCTSRKSHNSPCTSTPREHTRDAPPQLNYVYLVPAYYAKSLETTHTYAVLFQGKLINISFYLEFHLLHGVVRHDDVNGLHVVGDCYGFYRSEFLLAERLIALLPEHERHHHLFFLDLLLIHDEAA